MRQRRIMQDEGAVAGEEGGHLCRCGGHAIDGPCHARRGIAGDASAPGKRRLRRPARPRIGQNVPRRDVHHHERIKDDRQTPRPQIGDRCRNAGVGRRAAIGRRAVHEGHKPRGRPRDAGDRPVHDPRRHEGEGQRLERIVDARRDAAMARTQIVAEPNDDERDAFEVGTKRLQRIERSRPVGCREILVAVFRDGRARPRNADMKVRLIAEFRRTGNDVHGADHLADAIDRPHDLERQLRDAVAIGPDRQALEHHIGEPAIGRNGPRLLHRRDERIRRLILRTGVNTERDRREIELLPVRPDATHKRDRPFAQTDREIRGVGIGDLELRRLLHTSAALAAGRRLVGVVDVLKETRRPDHLAADARAAIGARNRRAFGGGNAVERRQPRPDRHARRLVSAASAGEQIAGKSPAGLAERHADGAAERAAQRTSDRGENERSHSCSERVPSFSRRRRRESGRRRRCAAARTE